MKIIPIVAHAAATAGRFALKHVKPANLPVKDFASGVAISTAAMAAAYGGLYAASEGAKLTRRGYAKTIRRLHAHLDPA